MERIQNNLWPLMRNWTMDDDIQRLSCSMTFNFVVDLLDKFFIECSRK